MQGLDEVLGLNTIVADDVQGHRGDSVWKRRTLFGDLGEDTGPR